MKLKKKYWKIVKIWMFKFKRKINKIELKIYKILRKFKMGILNRKNKKKEKI
jgi:hypothetical protein